MDFGYVGDDWQVRDRCIVRNYFPLRQWIITNCCSKSSNGDCLLCGWNRTYCFSLHSILGKKQSNLHDKNVLNYISFLIILGSLFSTVTLADHGFVGHSWSSMFRFIARNIGGEPAANFGRRRGFWLAVSDLELSCKSQKVIGAFLKIARWPLDKKSFNNVASSLPNNDTAH